MQEINIFEDISQETLKKVSASISNITDGEDLVINIASYGGELLPTISIIDLIQSKQLKTTANIIGFAASAAAILALSCDKVNMTRLGSLMIHSAWSDQSDDNDAGIQRCNSVQLQIINKRCKNITSDVLKTDTWFNAEQCLQLGLIDCITDEVGCDLIDRCYAYAASLKRGYSVMEEKVQEIIEEMKEEKADEPLAEEAEKSEEVEEPVAEGEEVVEEAKPDIWQVVEHLGTLIAELSERLNKLEAPKAPEAPEASCEESANDDERINSIYKNIMNAKVGMPQATVSIGKSQPIVKTFAKVDTKLYKSFLND